MKVTAKTQKIVTSVVLELTNDEATHLSYALKEYQELRKKHLNRLPWLWIEMFSNTLDNKRGVGCSMGPRAKE